MSTKVQEIEQVSQPNLVSPPHLHTLLLCEVPEGIAK